MGLCFSNTSDQAIEHLSPEAYNQQIITNQTIAESIAEDKKRRKVEKSKITLLLLGAGDVGKSTFCKQLLLGNGDEVQLASLKREYRSILASNSVNGIQKLRKFIAQSETQSNFVYPAELAASIQVLDKVGVIPEENDTFLLTPQIADAITAVWSHNDVKQTMTALGQSLEHAHFPGGIIGFHYCCENVQRFADPDFVPTNNDILVGKKRTIGVQEVNFVYQKVDFTIIDVGGQRNERKKWLNCFSTVEAVIFLAALNEYDQVLEEDPTTNRMVESLKLWKVLTNSAFFINTPFILFLNKSDLFQKKIEIVPLEDIFDEYSTFNPDDKMGGRFEKGCAFIADQYKQFSGTDSFVHHVTNATESTCCQKVFSTISENLFKDLVSDVGLYL